MRFRQQIRPALAKVILAAGLASCALATAFAESKRPNIVLLLADDMGYGNLACYGAADFSTPNIDRLAAEGLKFTDAHSPAAVCQPTRYGILSGRGYWRSNYGRIQSGYYFRENEILLPQLLKDAGYSTAMFGKWHLGFGLTQRGEETDWNGELKPGPLESGFDYWFGMPNAHNMPPFVFIENHRVYKGDPADPIRVLSTQEAKDKNVAAGGWGGSTGGKAAHDACPRDRLDLIMAGRAGQWIARQSKDRPFFLYVPFFAPHVPLLPAQEFQGKSPMALRLKRANNAARTSDVIQQQDHAVGMIMAALKEHGFAGNTLVVFSSDNGNLNLGDNQAVGFRTNGPFNGGKTDVWEGGHRVPLIAWWPGHIPAGRTSDNLVSLADLYRTLLAAADVPVPTGAGPDSLNMLPLMEEPSSGRGRLAMLYKGKGSALRVANWVYIPQQGPGGLDPAGGPAVKLGYSNSDYDEKGKLKPDAPPGQLYNLHEDPAQTTNLYGREPERVAILEDIHTKLWKDARKDVPLETYLEALSPLDAGKLGLPAK
jgi:arylsulfatase A